MRAAYQVITVAVVLTLGACAPAPSTPSTPQDLIVGKWELIGDTPGVVEEYTKDGKRKALANGQLVTESTYRFVDDKTLEFTTKGNKSTYKVTVTKDELTLTSGDDGVEKFKRVP